MNTTHNMKRLVLGLTTAVLLSGGAAGLVGPGIAQATPGPLPLNGGAWPGCPADHPAGPCHWCPGDPPVQTGNLQTDPVVWDNTICHTYYYDYPYGNVAKAIWKATIRRRRRHRRWACTATPGPPSRIAESETTHRWRHRFDPPVTVDGALGH